MIQEAATFARDRGAVALEAYPMVTGTAVTEELHVGMLNSYLEAGFTEIGRPTTRRAVVRVDCTAGPTDQTGPRESSSR